MRQIVFLLILVGLASLQGCYINANLMLKTDKNYVFDSIPKNTKTEYVISPNDLIQYKVFSNDGTRIVDISIGEGENDGGGGNGAGANVGFNNRTNLTFRVEIDSFVRLPVLDTVKIAGYTVPKAEELLEKLYSDYYVEPYVQLLVTNKRVIVFPGNGANASVIYLSNNNTTLMEVLALAGGVTERGRAKRIKIIRKADDGTRKMFMIDLSTAESGLQYTDLLVQANDYIYVDPAPQYTREVIAEISPIISIISSAILVYSVIQRL
jgi:polysaccharide export outer membrane protein